jgi:peptidylprolyl isomerase
MAMRLGEKADLICKSDYAYGDQGSPPKIPGGATLIFTVTLVWMDIKMSDEEMFEKANSLKAKGNEYFKSKEYELAINLYKDATEYLDKMSSWDDNEEMKKLRIACM